MIKKILNNILTVILLAVSFATGFLWQEKDFKANPPEDKWTVVIDPGHGGIDPGKVGTNNVVEKDIHKSSLISSICFALGMAGTGAFIYYGGMHRGSVIALIGIYLCYGLLMGIGLGTGYLSPVKTLMLWFDDRKGLATGLAVAGFGAAKVIASPIMQWMLGGLGEGGIYKMFLILAPTYFVMMFAGHLLLKKPDTWHEPQTAQEKKKILSVIKTKPIMNYIAIWVMFYLNITCGLALISQEKPIINCLGLTSSVGLISMLSAIFNVGGRIGFSAWADKMKDRNTIYKLIFVLSIIFTSLVIFTRGIENGTGNAILTALVIALIMVVNAGYGGGFSNVPALLSDHYGMSNISAIHGITLSAWGFAGLTGNQLASWIVKSSSNATVGYQNVLYVIVALYIISLLFCMIFVKPTKAK